MGGFFSAPDPPAPRVTPDPPKKEDQEVEETRRKTLQAAAKAKGQSDTILTGGLGAQDELPLANQTLLTGQVTQLGS